MFPVLVYDLSNSGLQAPILPGRRMTHCYLSAKIIIYVNYNSNSNSKKYKSGTGIFKYNLVKTANFYLGQFKRHNSNRMVYTRKQCFATFHMFTFPPIKQTNKNWLLLVDVTVITLFSKLEESSTYLAFFQQNMWQDNLMVYETWFLLMEAFHLVNLSKKENDFPILQPLMN